jgi:hypothetical protein
VNPQCEIAGLPNEQRHTVSAPLQRHVSVTIALERSRFRHPVGGAQIILPVSIDGDDRPCVWRQEHRDETVRCHGARLGAVHILDVRAPDIR